jgi:aspartyl-tRNA(Asn)/glutamyl-tRNA(Gln) amidotransferase subunit A
MTSIVCLTISELSSLLRDRVVSPVEVTESYLRRIEALNPILDAFITVTAERALDQARQAEREIQKGEYRGSLHGVPIAHKDIFYTRGVRTTAASRLLADFVPDFDATVVARLHRAGTVLLGKTQTYEFADGVDTLPPWPNPWDLDRTPGGSSAGSCSAVAAGLCAAATGTDTGGSVRQPASFCGVVGCKPTYGRVSRFGVIPLSWSLDHVGILARSVADAAMLLQVMAGCDSQDPTSVDVPVPDYSSGLAQSVRGLKIGLPREHFFERVEPGVAAEVQRAIQTLESLGMYAEGISLPHIEHALAAEICILWAEAAAYHQPDLRAHAQDYTPGIRNNLESGQYILATDYLHAQRVRRLVIEDFEKAFGQVDVVVAPTTPVTAPLRTSTTVTIEGEEETMLSAKWRFTYPSNLTGFPSLSVPCGFAGGLPVGMQIIARPFDESTMLQAAYAYEQAAGLDLHPPLDTDNDVDASEE